MNRRDFISLFGGVALAWSLAAHAQYIGFLLFWPAGDINE